MRRVITQMEHLRRMVMALDVKPDSLHLKSGIVKNMGVMQKRLVELVSVINQLNNRRRKDEQRSEGNKADRRAPAD